MAEVIPRSKREARAQSKQFFRDGKTGRVAILVNFKSLLSSSSLLLLNLINLFRMTGLFR